MKPLSYARAGNIQSAISFVSEDGRDGPPTAAARQFIAGGTNVMDFLKLSCWQTDTLIDINDLVAEHGRIVADDDGLRLGALVRMTQAAEHHAVVRGYPVISEALLQSATNQIRNMASLAGNVLQRTRCSYFRDVAYSECNKRRPGSGCAALNGNNREHAVLGVTEDCISTYPGDFAQALMALDAVVHVSGRDGESAIPFSELHLPAGRPEIETTLSAEDVITGFFVPAGPHTARSTYVKVRDRQSYAFGLATAAVALHLDDGVVVDARIALGGVAYAPWRARHAEAWLKGRFLDEDAAIEAGRLAFRDAVTHGQNAYKPELGARTTARALLQARAKEI
jgi:xanthine dehydrogenase YagS FAD-binding subunit